MNTNRGRITITDHLSRKLFPKISMKMTLVPKRILKTILRSSRRKKNLSHKSKKSNLKKKNRLTSKMTVSRCMKRKTAKRSKSYPKVARKYALISSHRMELRTRSTFRRLRRPKLTWKMYLSELRIRRYSTQRSSVILNRRHTKISSCEVNRIV